MNSLGIILKQGTIWYKDNWYDGDLLIEDGVIKEIKDEITDSKDCNQVIDVKGKIVIPGLIDTHVHLREPGFEDKETIETGSKAAVKGGYTTIAAMPNTNPVTDNIELIEFITNKAKDADCAKVKVIGAITKGEKGFELADLEGMQKSGVIGFSDDGRGVQSSSMMKEAMNCAVSLNLPIIAHCEDESLVKSGVVHDGKLVELFGMKGISSESEYAQIARDINLASDTGVHYHICHISTKESVELIREAKKNGINVTCEVTPHHLVLTEDDVKRPYSLYKVNPPLRSEEDRTALIEGLIDGTIDTIVTDHAPHTEEEKEQNMQEAPFGMVGIEIAFPVLYSQLVKTNIISLELLITKLTKRPAELFNLNAGIIDINLPADITVIDLYKSEEVNTNKFLSKGKNTPFRGWELEGWPVITIVEGEVKWIK